MVCVNNTHVYIFYAWCVCFGVPKHKTTNISNDEPMSLHSISWMIITLLSMADPGFSVCGGKGGGNTSVSRQSWKIISAGGGGGGDRPISPKLHILLKFNFGAGVASAYMKDLCCDKQKIIICRGGGGGGHRHFHTHWKLRHILGYFPFAGAVPIRPSPPPSSANVYDTHN